MTKAKTETIWTSGGRKTARARIKMREGKGEWSINDIPPEIYFPLREEHVVLYQPFGVVGKKSDEFTVSLKVAGGGKRGQLEACRHAIARALEKYDPELRPVLKKEGLLTRDARIKERKKYGLKKARRAPQFSKR